MSARKAPDLTNYFSKALQSQQISEAEQEIQRLRAEIEELRSQGSTELEEQLQELSTGHRKRGTEIMLPWLDWVGNQRISP